PLTPQLSCSSLYPTPPRSTLFPYTTLFRSKSSNSSCLTAASCRSSTKGLVGIASEDDGFPGSGDNVNKSSSRITAAQSGQPGVRDRKSTRLNSSHLVISYAVFCLKKKKKTY